VRNTSGSPCYVFVSNGKTYERRPVQIGLSDFFHAEVQQGLAEGEIVCLEPPAEQNIVTIKNTAGIEPQEKKGSAQDGGSKPKPAGPAETKPASATTTTTTSTSS
jgi:hypothetical protein